MANPAIINASELDYDAYTDQQRDSYSELLAKRGVPESTLTPDFFRWKYNPPDGPARLCLVADGGNIISSTAFVPSGITCEGIGVTAWHAVDAATRRDFRGKGYFYSCIRAFFETLGPNEIFYGFPNASSLPTYRKIGVVERLTVRTWVHSIGLSQGRKNPGIVRVKRFDERLDKFFEGLSCGGNVTIMRGSERLNWRYADHPINNYDLFIYDLNDVIEGCAVTRIAKVRGRPKAMIMELWSSGPESRREILRSLGSRMRASGQRMIFMMDSGISAVAGIREGYVPVPQFLLPKRQVLILYAPATAKHDLFERNWRMQIGDWDVF